MQVSAILILTRTAGRLASLLGGFANPLNQSQPATLILDGALVLVACIILTAVPVGSAFRAAWTSTSPSFQHRSSGRRNGYRRPANISLPVPAPLYSPGSPPYYYSASSSPGHHLLSPPLPTPPLHTFTPRSPPYHQIGAQQQQQEAPVPPPPKASPGRPPYDFAAGHVPLMSPGFSPGRAAAGFVPSHRRQQAASRSLVNSEALW